MATQQENWARVRQNGFGRYLLLYGLFVYGLPFAGIMTFWHPTQRSAIGFAIYLLFGPAMASAMWWVNERQFDKSASADDERETPSSTA